MKIIIKRLVGLKRKYLFVFFPTVFSSGNSVGRAEKLKAQITIDCVCLELIASLASVHNNHNDRRRQGRVERLSHLCFIEKRGCGNIEFSGISKCQVCSLSVNVSLWQTICFVWN